MLRHGHPTPRLAPQRPVAAVYVDKALIVAWDFAECAFWFGRVLEELGLADLSFHDVVRPCKIIVFVGLELDLAPCALVFQTPLSSLDSHRV